MKSILSSTLVTCVAAILVSGCSGSGDTQHRGEDTAAEVDAYCTEVSDDDFCQEREGDIEQTDELTPPDPRDATGGGWTLPGGVF